ncbi:uncharacterized protein LOC127801710 [Diospyros lotus]|uniref:uncharacterized protein LOC127801710 n=1 Tax=Diospyros lotus TaxID=55363 RepID=UPI00224CAF52|nr:uncharacterized protein LOC127801710 [Diospyros lotus]
MYHGAETRVRTCGGDTEPFKITIGLHQGSALSLYLFALVMDELTKDIQTEVPWCMLFTDDIVLVDEIKEGVNTKLELWRNNLESKGLKLSRKKTEYMECKFSKNARVEDVIIKLENQILQRKDHFRYLGSMIQKDGEIHEYVTHKIKAGWLKWRNASGVLCDGKIPLKLKRKFYRTAIRPVLLYGSECWVVKYQHEQKTSVAEMGMLRWMRGHTRKDKIRNEVIHNKVRVVPIEEKMRETRLRWFGHVKRRPRDTHVRRVDEMEQLVKKRGRGRPKKTLGETLKFDMKCMDLNEDMTKDRNT